MKHPNRNEFNMVVCPKCGTIYHWTIKRCPECNYPQRPAYKNPLVYLVAILIIALGLVKFGVIQLPKTVDQKAENISGKAEDIVSQELEIVPVENKEILKQPEGDLVCSLKVRASYAAGGNNYYIYCKDLNGDNDCAFYLENGTTIELMMPLGDYSVYYCVGKNWYGTEKLFGTGTVSYKM